MKATTFQGVGDVRAQEAADPNRAITVMLRP